MHQSFCSLLSKVFDVFLSLDVSLCISMVNGGDGLKQMKNGLLRSSLRLSKRLMIHNLCYVVTITLKALTLSGK